jgi:type I restriction enzyme S subunit
MSLDLLFPNFETLIRTPEDVARLNAAILQLAVQGKLVPQDPADEPASELLKRIRAEKRRLVKEGKLQEAKPLPTLAPADNLFDLPQGWVWTRLGNLVEFEYGKGLPQKARADDGNVPVYGSNGVVGYHSEALVDSPCVVIGRKGSSGAVNLSPIACWVIDTAFYVVPPSGTDLGFIFRLVQSLKLDELGKGIKPGLNRNEAYNLVVGLPPLAEQRRIVAKVESLFAQTRGLEAKLRQAEELRRKLVEAVLHSAFS